MAVQFEKPIALGADHGGYELKEAIKQHLEERGIAYRDFGSFLGKLCQSYSLYEGRGNLYGNP